LVLPDIDEVSLLPTQESVLMTFGPVIGGEITSGIKPRLFLADSSDAGALSVDVDMARCCIDCELKPSIDVFFWSEIGNLSSDEA